MNTRENGVLISDGSHDYAFTNEGIDRVERVMKELTPPSDIYGEFARPPMEHTIFDNKARSYD